MAVYQLNPMLHILRLIIVSADVVMVSFLKLLPVPNTADLCTKT